MVTFTVPGMGEFISNVQVLQWSKSVVVRIAVNQNVDKGIRTRKKI